MLLRPFFVLVLALAGCGAPSVGGDAAPMQHDGSTIATDGSTAPTDGSTSPIDSSTPVDGSTGTGTPRDAASVFFSGHSLINVNTPAFFAQLAQSEARTVSYQLQMGLGSTMGIRLACPRSGQEADGGPIGYEVQAELARSGVYDTLIVTERHDIVTAIAYERSTAMARRFRDAFTIGNPRGQSFLFESWYTIDVNAPEPFRERATRELVAWECIASKVNESRGEAPPMLVVPAGQALVELVGDVRAGRAPGITSLRQVFEDDVHLTNLGNYFVALLHYGVAYRRSPVGLSASGLRPIAGASPSISAETAAYLQALAARTVERTFADAASSQRDDGECVARLTTLCEQTLGAGDFGCRQIGTAYRDDTAAVPTFDGSWCRR